MHTGGGGGVHTGGGGSGAYRGGSGAYRGGGGGVVHTANGLKNCTSLPTQCSLCNRRHIKVCHHLQPLTEVAHFLDSLMRFNVRSHLFS